MPRYFLMCKGGGLWGLADNPETVIAWAALQDLKMESIKLSSDQFNEHHRLDNFDLRSNKNA